jgi:hypothetical protein
LIPLPRSNNVIHYRLVLLDRFLSLGRHSRNFSVGLSSIRIHLLVISLLLIAEWLIGLWIDTRMQHRGSSNHILLVPLSLIEPLLMLLIHHRRQSASTRIGRLTTRHTCGSK